VTTLIFSDGSTQWSAGGGGGGGPLLFPGDGISFLSNPGPPPSITINSDVYLWQRNVNGGGHDLVNVANIDVTNSFRINGVPFAVAGSVNLTNINQISAVSGQTLALLATGTPAVTINGNPVLIDPTTALGDLLVRGATGVNRLAAGTDTYILTADSAQPLGVHWAAPPSAPVSSVFGRTGAVVAANGDYTAAQVTNAVDSTGSYADPSWITSLAWSKITNAPDMPEDILTTKGDIMGFDTEPVRIPVGTNNQALLADSATASGLRWATITADIVNLNPQVTTWTTVQNAISAISSTLALLSRGMTYVGFYDAAAGVATFVPAMSSLDGPLPAADAAGIEEGDFLVVTTAATAPMALDVGDQLISGGPTGGPTWIRLPIGHSLATVTAATVPLAPVIGSWTTVQVALTDLNTRAAAAGAATQIQYNAGGSPAAFGASAYLTWDNATATLNLSSGAGGSPGVHISEPTNSRSGDVYVDDVGMAILAGAGTSLYIESPAMIEITAGSGGMVLESGATAGEAFQFTTGSSDHALVILPNDNVGIGTLTPDYKLQVVGDINITGTTPVYRVNGVPLAFDATQILLNPAIGSWTTVQNAVTALNTRAQAAGAVGQVQYNAGGAPPVFGASANLFWDSANSRLGIGQGSPAYDLDVDGDINCTGTFYVDGVAFASPGSAHLHATTISGLDGDPLQITGDVKFELNGNTVTLGQLLDRLDYLEMKLGRR
jgi:hypothetical protein